MTAPDPASAAAEKVDSLLDKLRSSRDPRAAVVAEELMRCVVQLYGDGLTRIMALAGSELAARLCADPLVESLLLVHDLHPVPAADRIRQALDAAAARIGEAELLGVDESGVAHVRLATSGRSVRTATATVEAIVASAAPDLAGVDVQAPPPAPPLLQVGLRPGISRPTRAGS